MNDDESLHFYELLDMAIESSPEAFRTELDKYKTNFNSLTYTDVMNRKINDLFTLQSVICEFRLILQKELPIITFINFMSVESAIYKHIFDIFKQFI